MRADPEQDGDRSAAGKLSSDCQAKTTLIQANTASPLHFSHWKPNKQCILYIFDIYAHKVRTEYFLTAIPTLSEDLSKRGLLTQGICTSASRHTHRKSSPQTYCVGISTNLLRISLALVFSIQKYPFLCSQSNSGPFLPLPLHIQNSFIHSSQQ